MTSQTTELSEEELAAISDAMSDSISTVINASGRSVAVSHDLAREDTALGFNQSAVDLVNERFARQVRMGLIEVLRTTPKITVNKVEIKTFNQSIKNLVAPLAISTVRMEPLRGISLIIIDPTIIFSTLDSFFGGNGKGGDEMTVTKLFTPTEETIINLLMNIILGALKEAWAPLLQVEFQRVGQEVNPAFAQIADDEDSMLVSSFEFGLGEDKSGFVEIIQPFSMLKPIRDLLRSRIVTTDEENEQTLRWTNDLRGACEDIPLDVKVAVSAFELSLGELEQLEVDQMIPVELFERAKVHINDSVAFHGVVGEIDGKMAVEIGGRLSGDEGEYSKTNQKGRNHDR